MLLLWLTVASAFSAYDLQPGWTYYIEAVRAQAWPSCRYRFASYPSACNSINLWEGAGTNQRFTFEPAPNGDFYLKGSCGHYVSYPGDCSQDKVDMWPEAGVNQAFKFIKTGDFEFHIEATGRRACPLKYLSFPVPCTTGGPDKLDFWNALGAEQTFRVHAAAGNTHKHRAFSATPCADPFAWHDRADGKYRLVCTGGAMGLLESTNMSYTAVAKAAGVVLGGSAPKWASSGARWAPENIEVTQGNRTANVVFFADQQASDGRHRVGWAWSDHGAVSKAWTRYSVNYLSLGNARGGEIDVHVFRDDDGVLYLFWKTDDNSVGASTTRIWAQEISIDVAAHSVALKGQRKEVLNSAGLWWIDSWVAGGSLIEGPEVVKRNGIYYLFFAAGKYCQDSYSEGVARSKSIWGPYEKLGVPLLSTGMVGYSVGGEKIVGPGHASFVMNNETKQLFAVWHGSPGENCNRYAFLNELSFEPNGWPRVAFE